MITTQENDLAIEKAISVLKKGGLIIFPCETVYGVAVDAANSDAVKRLNEYKSRPLGKPYAIMCSSKEMAEKYVEINSVAADLYKKFLPGPVTIVSKGKHTVATGIESESGTLGVRIPDYKFMVDLIEKFGRPIVATSANSSYKKRPYSTKDIFDNISKKQKALVDLVIDSGDLPHNEPSTVIDTSHEETVILRQGDIKIKDKNEVLSRSEENTQNIGKELWQKYDKYHNQRALVFALQGEMGAGKTQLTKGIAKAMEIADLVTSPTYALENEYGETNNKLFHFDAWRLNNSSELEQLGFSELIKRRSVIVVEWAKKVENEIRKHDSESVIVWVNIKIGQNENERLVSWGVL